LKQAGETKITLAELGKAAVRATFAAAVSDIPVELKAPLDAFQGSDEDFIRDCFVPGIQRAGGVKAAQLLLRH